MLKGLTQAGLGHLTSLTQFIELAAHYGFESVDLEPKSLVEEVGGVEEAKALLLKNQMTIGAMSLTVEWRGNETDFQEGILHLAKDASLAQALGCTRCVTYILPSTDLKPAHFMVLATRRLRVVADLLATYGISLGLEFVGPYHLRTTWNYPFIWTMEETLDWINAIQRPNVGLTLDAIHWYTTGLSVEDLESLTPEQIVHVHINDVPNVPVEEVLDNNRLYTGEGVIDLKAFLKALKKIGYQGPVAQEVLTQIPPTDSTEDLFRRSKVGYDKVFSEL